MNSSLFVSDTRHIWYLINFRFTRFAIKIKISYLTRRFAALLGTDGRWLDNYCSVKIGANFVGNHVGWDIFQSNAGASTLASIISIVTLKTIPV
jgi:hypothetical protein